MRSLRAKPDYGSLPTVKRPGEGPTLPHIRNQRVRRKIPWDQRRRALITVPDVVPMHAEAVKRAGVHFGITTGWTFGDGHRWYCPHLVMYNVEGYAHFVLPFLINGSRLIVLGVQRENSTLGTFIDHRQFWEGKHLPAEREVARELRQRLGVHPSEVLFTQLLYRFRNRLSSGRLKLEMKKLEKHDNPHLAERFFKRVTDSHARYYTLNTDKRRVREALGLSPLKK